VLYDSHVPPPVVDPLFGDRSRISEVVGVAPEAPVFDVPTSRLRVVRPDGTLAEPVFLDPATAPPGDNAQCSHPVRAEGTSIPLDRSLPDGGWVARLGYYTSSESFAELRTDADETGFAVTPGLHVVYAPVDGPVDALDLTLADVDGTLCVTDVEVGAPQGAGSP
jgi:hypothetical protein